MAEPKCPECPHPVAIHTRWCGCRHQKRGASGALVICPCTRTFK